MDLELRHLRVVCAIADQGSLTKAAATLGLAQPALTAQLRRIEESLGGVLFDRGRHGARPTALGELVLTRARVVLPAVQSLRDEAIRLANAGPTRYRIGAANSPLLGGLVRRLSAEQPDVPITVQPAWSASDLAAQVSDAALDFALVGVCGNAPPPAGPELTWRTIALDPVFVLLKEDLPHAAEDEVKLGDLADTHWGATPGGGCFGDCFARACAEDGFTPKPMYEVDITGCIDLALGGDTAVLCQPTFRLVPGLISVPLAGTPLRWRHLLGWHPGSPAAAHATRLVRHASAAYQDAVGHSPRYQRWLNERPGFGAASHGHP